LKALLGKAEWWRDFVHFRIMNLNHFKMVEAMGIKIMASWFPSMASPATKFHENPSRSLKVIEEDKTVI
jgi:hypothetical protein